MHSQGYFARILRDLLALFLLASLDAFTEVDARAGSVILGWEPDPDPQVIGYNVYYGSASRDYTNAISVGAATNATVSGLREGLTYFFAVTAYTWDGLQSDYSAEVSQFMPITDRSRKAFLPVSGAYNGLFFETNQIRQFSSGFFSLVVSAAGAYSGHVQIGASRSSFHGQLDSWCQATNLVSQRDSNLLSIGFRIAADGQPGHIRGQVSNGQWSAAISADCARFGQGSLPTPFAGIYTCIVPGVDSDASVPQGYGFGTARVTSGGTVFFTGALADGTRLTQSATVSQTGLWPFYAALYSGGGALLSWLAFTNRATDDLNGAIVWNKPAIYNTRYYPAGFTNYSHIFGSSYHVPSPPTDPVLELTNPSLAFSGGNLGAGFTNLIALGRSSRVTNQSTNSLTMRFSPPGGTFKGSVVNPDTGRTLPFSGAVFQKVPAGYGFLLDTNRSASVLLLGL